MDGDREPRLVSAPRAPRFALTWARVCALFTVFAGATVWIGWWTGADVLVQLGAEGGGMKANAALGLLMAGSALAFLVLPVPVWLRWGMVVLLGALTVILGGGTFLQYATGRDLGIDEALIIDHLGSAETPVPGRMSPNAALSLLFVGGGLLLRLIDASAAHRLAELFAAAAALFGFQALVGYAYGVELLYALPETTAMAPHTAVGVLVLASGVLLGSPSHGFVGSLLRSGFSATVLGGLVPVAVLGPFLLGLLALLGVERGLYSPIFAVSLLVVLVTVFFIGFVGWTARQLWEADLERLEAEALRREEAEVVRNLHEIGRMVAGELDREELARELLDAAARLVGAARAAFVLRNEAGGPRTIATGRAGGEAFPGDPEVAARTLERGETVRLTDVSLRAGRTAEGGVRAYLAVPVRDRSGGVRGGLFFGRAEPGAFRRRHERIAEGVADWARLALENARLYAAEQSARERAERAVREREDVLAVVSHDLRNPLGTISSAAALLQELDLDEEKRHRQLDVIQRSSQHMNRLIQDLLDLAKIEGGGFTLDCGPVGVGELLLEVRSLFEGQAARMGVAVEVEEAPEGEPRVRADRERVLQIFSNLVGNALRHAPAGSTVGVGARAEEAEVRFLVRNEGEAIPAASLPHLFDRFWRGGEQEDRTGAGLGLAIVKGIVDAHGGRVGAESPPGGLTTFWFTLPVQDGAEGEPVTQPGPACGADEADRGSEAEP